jgi:hypothetical protein
MDFLFDQSEHTPTGGEKNVDLGAAEEALWSTCDEIVVLLDLRVANRPIVSIIR